MEFQTINNKSKKRMVVGSIILVGILSIGIFAASRAKYKVTDTVKLGEGTVNYTLPDINIVGMYLVENGTETEINKDPGSGYVLMDKSYCNDKNGNKDTSVTLGTIDGSTTFGNLGKGSKCYLYFEKDKPSSEKTLAKLNLTAETCPTSFTGISGSSEAKLCSGIQDQDGDTYYFRGMITNNWVSFAGFYWRIIRINGDGTIRMIYNGTSTNTTGEATQLGTKAFNSTSNSAEYVGLQYTLGEQYGTGINSTILGTTTSTDATTLYGWYNTKIKGTDYEKYVDTNTVFCSDRDTVNYFFGYTGSGTGTAQSAFSPAKRFLASNWVWNTTQAPLMTCATNNQLRLPIGLITIDEVVFAGGFGCSNTNARTFWLNTGQNYWTMSPYRMDGSDAYVFRVDTSGLLGWIKARSELGVRPVINLRSDVKLTGSGTTTSPYEIVS